MAAYLQILLISLALALAFAVLERLRPIERDQPRRRWLFNLAYTPFILALAIIVGIALGPVFARAAAVTNGGLLPDFGSPGASVPAQIGFALLYAFAVDFIQYWFHRMQHSLPFLWATHRFHHDETALNAAAQSRVHITSFFLLTVLHLPVILLFGARAPHFVAVFIMFTLWGFVSHANVRIGFGRLTPVLTGPQLHRLHHSRLPQHRDCNFAGYFPVIDVLFGTYRKPGLDEYPPTGLGGAQPSSIYGATVEPFVGWAGALRGLARGSRRA